MSQLKGARLHEITQVKSALQRAVLQGQPGDDPTAAFFGKRYKAQSARSGY